MNSEENNGNTKKPFDKKKYRFKKYSNKFKVQQWEERRKTIAQRKLFRELSKEEREQLLSKKNQNNFNKSENNAFTKAKQEFLRKQEEKKRKREEALRKKEEREEAMKRYKENKLKKLKAISQRTKKGQPLMRDRIKLLLEKIQGTN